ncbi:MAG: hypothetical protein WCF93_04000 [Candidatus Moraniibacteriota bacterium]
MNFSAAELYMKEAFKKVLENIKISLPILIGVLLLLNLLQPLFEKYYSWIFTGNLIIDPLIGAVAGSLSFGIPVVSYLTGGELIKQGVTLLAVTAFIFSWTTVGIPMIPLESENLGKRFAIVRNGFNFIFSIFIAILTVFILRFFHYV